VYFGGLYHCAKFGSNRSISGFESTGLNILRLPKIGVLRHLPQNKLQYQHNPKKHILAKLLSIE